MTEHILRFLNLIAWFALFWYGFLGTLSLWWALTYSDFERSLDTLRSVRRTFPWPKYLTFAFLAAAWLYVGTME